MVKSATKSKITQSNLINYTSPKSKQQIDKEYYQKNQAKKKAQQRERYYQKKEQAELSTKQQLGKYYGAEAFKILISFKNYVELNKDKRQL